MISQSTQYLISRYISWYQSLQSKEGVATIHVDEVASKVAAFYEKIRGVVDWREEHLMRRAAIERILKRRLFFSEQERPELATSFVQELIRGGYFPNDSIPEEKIEVIQTLIRKYIFLLNNNSAPSLENLNTKLFNLLLAIAACEVEEVLDPPRRERALIEYMFDSMKEKIKLKGQNTLTEEEKNIQIYISVQKALFKLDSSIISYHLLKQKYPEWIKLPRNQLEEINKNIYPLLEDIQKKLNHPLGRKLYRICEKYDTPYLILGDIIAADPLGALDKLQKPDALENLTREFYRKRLNQLKSRIKRAAIFSTISIFATKMLLAFAIEIPVDKYITGQFSYTTLGFSILLPPLLMFFLVLTTRPPNKSNLELVIMEVMKIAYRSGQKETYEVKSFKKRGLLLTLIINIFYLATFIIAFGFIWLALGKLHFGNLSRIIFLIFFSLICFAGVKIRERAKELTIEEGKEGFLIFLFESFFALPFIRVGKWLSGQWARYNIIIILLTALIDMPFQLFTEFLEQWRYFLKEKKEEIH